MDTEQVFGTPTEARRLIAATTGFERVKWVRVAQATHGLPAVRTRLAVAKDGTS
jgi:hypothetical protein